MQRLAQRRRGHADLRVASARRADVDGVAQPKHLVVVGGPAHATRQGRQLLCAPRVHIGHGHDLRVRHLQVGFQVKVGDEARADEDDLDHRTAIPMRIAALRQGYKRSISAAAGRSSATALGPIALARRRRHR